MAKVVIISFLFALFGVPGVTAPVVLTGSHGERVSLARYSGKPLIFFYEDKDSTQVNRALKERLKSWGRAHNLMDAAHVVGVANLQAYNFFPVRGIALGHVRGVEERIGFPVLADLEGALTSPPWSLPAQSSTVVVLDGDGSVVFRKTGALAGAQIDEVVHVLEELLH